MRLNLFLTPHPYGPRLFVDGSVLHTSAGDLVGRVRVHGRQRLCRSRAQEGFLRGWSEETIEWNEYAVLVGAASHDGPYGPYGGIRLSMVDAKDKLRAAPDANFSTEFRADADLAEQDKSRHLLRDGHLPRPVGENGAEFRSVADRPGVVPGRDPQGVLGEGDSEMRTLRAAAAGALLLSAAGCFPTNVVPEQLYRQVDPGVGFPSSDRTPRVTRASASCSAARCSRRRPCRRARRSRCSNCRWMPMISRGVLRGFGRPLSAARPGAPGPGRPAAPLDHGGR